MSVALAQDPKVLLSSLLAALGSQTPFADAPRRRRVYFYSPCIRAGVCHLFIADEYPLIKAPGVRRQPHVRPRPRHLLHPPQNGNPALARRRRVRNCVVHVSQQLIRPSHAGTQANPAHSKCWASCFVLKINFGAAASASRSIYAQNAWGMLLNAIFSP